MAIDSAHVHVRFKHGNTAANNSYTGLAGELSIDDTTGNIRLHDGSTAGGHETAVAADVVSATDLNNLTNTTYWTRSNLTNVSSLQNDKGYQTGHCSHCTYCSHCNQCGYCTYCTRCTQYCTYCTQNCLDP